MAKVLESSVNYTEINRMSSNFSSSIELLRKETDLLNGGDRDIAKYYFINNVCDLEDKSAENVAGFIKYRFFKRQIYTWTGQTLIAVQSYERDFQEKTEKNDANIYVVVSRAWFNLSNRLGKVNQCIVISGDSGSGKTYSGCVALKYLGSQPQICDQEILNHVLYKAWSSVPLLAAFGNASTFHNSNSSRFGKLIQIQCYNGKIVGAFIQTFMLERSRVSEPNRAETNFHIFHQILYDVDESSLEKVYLSKKTEYKICPKIPHYQYSSYKETIKAMQFLHITQIDGIMGILSLILNLGNIDFISKDDKLIIPPDCKQYVNFCSKILQCNTSSFTQLLLKRLVAPKLRKGSLCYTSCVNIEECQERKNSFMRFLYDKLFNWLVESINNQMIYEHQHDCLGILDIYGFESFFHNTFEQLCINYANERLHQYYIHDFFNKQVNFLYENYDRITTKYDLTKFDKRINILDGTLSVFGILNEECLVKRYNTDIFIGSRLSSNLGKEEFFIARSEFRNTKFSIKHYAGIVEYDCRSMVNKNRDKIPEEMILLLNETKFEFLRQVISSRHEEIQYIHGKTLLSKFKKSLDNLMVTLDKADVHYIKCLKPNQKQIANYFDEQFFIEQLRYNGIMDTLKLEFQSFSIVISKPEFSSRFGDKILGELRHILRGKVYVGKDKIYFNEHSFDLILRYKSILLLSYARKIQRYWRARNKKRHQAATKIQQCFRKLCQMKPINQNDTFDSTFDGITVIENVYFRCETSSTFEEIEIKNKVNSRGIFRGDGIVSRQRIAQVPVRCHIKKTCIPFSYILPIQETPCGLCDIF